MRDAAALLILVLFGACAPEADLEETAGGVRLVYALDGGADPEAALGVVRTRLSEVLRRGAAAELDPTGYIIVLVQDAEQADRAKSLLSRQGELAFLVVASDDPGVIQAVLDNGGRAPAGLHLAVTRNALEPHLLLEEAGDPALTGANVRDASPGFHPVSGEPVVNFLFDAAGAAAFAAVTADHVGDRLAITMDGEVLTAPRLMTPIPSGRAFIEGSFTLAEAQDLAALISSGALPASLTLIEETAAD